MKTTLFSSTAVLLFLNSCLPAVDNDLPQVSSIKLGGYPSQVIPPNLPQIDSKEALIAYVDSAASDTNKSYSYYHYSSGQNYRTTLEIDIWNCNLDSFTVHVVPKCKEVNALSYELYPNGMPITLYRNSDNSKHIYTSMYYKPDLESRYDTVWFKDSSDYVLSLRYDTAAIIGKPLILTDGYSELADSSYNNEIILPLRNSSTPSGKHPNIDWSFEVLFPFEVRYF